MARRRIIGWTVLSGAIVLVAAGAVAYLVIVPSVVRGQVRAVLEDAGFEQVRFELARGTLWGSRLENVVLGVEDPLRVASVELEYGLSILWTRRLEAVRLSGVELVAASQPQPGRAVSVPIALRRIGQRSEASSGPGEAPGSALPFARIEVVDSVLVVPTPSGPVRFPVRGTIDNAGGEQPLNFTAALMLNRAAVGIEGTYAASQQRLAATLTGGAVNATLLGTVISAFLPGLRMDLAGEVDLRGTLEHGDGVSEFVFSMHPRDLAVLRGGTNFEAISGVFELEGSVGGAEPARLALTLVDATFENEKWGMQVSGAAGRVVFDSLSPLSTDGVQEATVRRLTLGELELTDGMALFELHGPQSLEIRRTQWHWLGGTLWADAFAVDPTAAVVELTLRLKSVELARVLEVFAEEQASGTGRISGEIPMRIDWPRVEFGDGVLYATTDGDVQIRNREFLQSLEATGERGVGGEQLSKVAEALGDFAYEVLQAELRQDEHGLSAHVRMKGRGRRGNRTGVDYNLNVSGIDAAVETLLGLRARVSQPPSRERKADAP